MADPQRYTQHLDTVLALVSNLGLTTKEHRATRSAYWLTDEVFGKDAKDDDSLRKEIQCTLDKFPGLFRKVTSQEGEIRYTLHLRWAMAQGADPDSQPPLTADLLQALLDFVSKRAEAEATEKQFRENIEMAQNQFRENVETATNQFRENIDVTKSQLRITKIGAIIAAAAALLAFAATIIAAIINH